MVALGERLGTRLGDLVRGLRTREAKESEDTPYGNAQRLWAVLAPGREINPLKSAFFQFGLSYDEGVKTESEEQNIFRNLLEPYRGLFPELDTFFVSLSLGGKSDDVSFKLTVFAPPPSPKSTHDEPYRILEIIELPEQERFDKSRILYNVVILGESENRLYTGRLDEELVGLSPEKEWISRENRKLSDKPEGDIKWRRHFASETLKLLTRMAETGKDDVANWNQKLQADFKEQEEKASLLRQMLSLWNQRQPGAILPDNINLRALRAMTQ